MGHYKAECPNELQKRLQVVKQSSIESDDEDEASLLESDETENA